MVFEILGKGRETAQTGKELATVLGVDLRLVAKSIERERRAGHPICADASGGYYLAGSAEELEQYRRSLNRRIGNYRQTLQAVDDTLANMTGQGVLSD